jgi:hypothetical protein
MTSMLMSGPGIPGDKVVGESTPDFKPTTFNTSTLAQDDAGIRINTNHVHKALRKVAKIDTSAVAAQFGLLGEDLPLFS